MSDKKKASRWLNLVAYLLGNRFAKTRAEIFEHVGGYGSGETGRRMFERDKDEIRSLGIDIQTIRFPGAAGDDDAAGYRLKPRDTYLPYLELLGAPSSKGDYDLQRIVLTRDELETLDRATRELGKLETPLAEAAASARRKLAFDLPLTSEAVASILAHPIPVHARQALEILQEAVIHRRAIACRYFTMSRRSEEERHLEPWGLLFQWGRWYCIARARDREEPRIFRLDRMRHVKALTGSAARFKVPDEFDVRAFAGRSPWEFGSGPATRAVVRFAFPESRSIENLGVGQVVREGDDRSAVMAFDVRDEDTFLRWLLQYGRRAEIEQPASFRDSLTALRTEVAAMYSEASP